MHSFVYFLLVPKMHFVTQSEKAFLHVTACVCDLQQVSLSIPVAELHGLSSSRPLVEQGGVGHRHACDVTDHGLVIEERLQATLGDLRLVGCVLSHPEGRTDTMGVQT